jgi:hypothetical protein
MKKVGSSFKKLGAIFLGLVLLFLLFSMFSGSKEGFYRDCGTSETDGSSCSTAGDTCTKVSGGATIEIKCKRKPNSNEMYWRSRW